MDGGSSYITNKWLQGIQRLYHWKATWILSNIRTGAQFYGQSWGLGDEDQNRALPIRTDPISDCSECQQETNLHMENLNGSDAFVLCYQLCYVSHIFCAGLTHNNRELNGYISHFHYKLNIIVFLIKDTLICSGCVMFVFRYNDKSNYFETMICGKRAPPLRLDIRATC